MTMHYKVYGMSEYKPMYDGLSEFIEAVNTGAIDPSVVAVRIRKEHVVGEIRDKELMYLDREESLYKYDGEIESQQIFKERGKPHKVLVEFFDIFDVPAAYRKNPL